MGRGKGGSQDWAGKEVGSRGGCAGGGGRGKSRGSQDGVERKQGSGEAVLGGPRMGWEGSRILDSHSSAHVGGCGLYCGHWCLSWNPGPVAGAPTSVRVQELP